MTEINNRVLITGGTGLLGTHLILSKPESCSVFASVHHYKNVIDVKNLEYVELDVANQAEVVKVIQAIKPAFIFHTAAHGRVDFCESHPEEAHAVNYEATRFIVDAANTVGSRVIFCSTNMIFDGLEAPYNESSLVTPQTVYGKTKVKAEVYIREHAKNYTIFRLMTMYGWNWQPERKNMISMSIEKLTANQDLWMTNDVFNNMLYVAETARVFWSSIQSEIANQQTYHLAGNDCLNRYETTLQVCKVFELNKKLVHEVSSDYFKGQEVPRSPNTCFDTSKIESKFEYSPLSVIDGLIEMKSDQPMRKSLNRKNYEAR
ncbi:MAG: SDR family oxidoreductase [Patescibacteria group bacterium]